MINDEELGSLLDIDSELSKIICDLKDRKEISSIYKSLLTWKIGHIKEDVQKREEELLDKSNSHQKNVIKKNIILVLIAFLLVGYVFYSKSFWGSIIFFLIYAVMGISLTLKLRCKNIEYTFISIKKIYQNIDQIERILSEIKIIVDKEDKKIKEDLVLQIFNQANLDLEEMTYTENINLNFKDRAYRNFIINLYDLKINEKELNNFYRKVVKMIILDDLQNSCEF